MPKSKKPKNKNKDKNEKPTNDSIVGKLEHREIITEMQDSYLDYAMSVIVARALPDVRDGLKPVHRRILYSMHHLGLRASARYLKSANVVGDVLGKYHPHGDLSVYDALVRMAQDFSFRYPLINGQGNFGSIDGDPAAAYRYTEVKMKPITEELLADIEKDTVNFAPNYDGRYQEPTVLPTKIPQLLLNGTVGIAVGMATNIPPHNLSEVIDALIFLLSRSKATTADLLDFIQGPDFPTGGIIYNAKDILEAYSTGRGGIVMRAKCEIVEGKRGANQILVTEIPFQVNKADLIKRIADLVRDKKIIGIKDIRDESDREGMRIAIDLKGDAYPQKLLNKLFKSTDLQKSFHLNMLALVDGIQPQVLSLKVILEKFLEHRKEVVRRRSEFDLARARERSHILEGLKKALDSIDRVIKTIKQSRDREDAQVKLMKTFKFTERQAVAILEMRLQTLAALERKKIEDELKEKRKLIKELTLILKDPKRLQAVIKEELLAIKEKYGDPRRTKLIKGSVEEFKEEDLVPAEETLVTLSFGGYVKRINPTSYKVQKRGGKGIIGVATKEEDQVEHFLRVNTHDWVLFFTSLGRLYQLRAFEIPEGKRATKGRSILNFLNLAPQERITAILPLKEKLSKSEAEKYFVMVTKNGKIKKTALDEFVSSRRSGLVAIKLTKEDVLGWVMISSGKDEIILATKKGQAIRFSEKDVRTMGRSTAGVTALKLKKGDEVVGTSLISGSKEEIQKLQLLLVAENGFGKKVLLNQFKKQRRAGQGIKTAKLTEKTGLLVSAQLLGGQEEDLIAVSKRGQVLRTSLGSISVLGRATQGVRIMKLDTGDKIASVTTL
jgi:DNA gyrase subunit A